MARGKYGAGSASAGGDYDLVDIGYVPTGSPSRNPEPDQDPDLQSSGSARPVARWRRVVADAIAPKSATTARGTSSRSTANGSTSSATTARRTAPGGRTAAPARPASAIVYGLDRREQIISAALAVIAIAFAIAIGVVGSHPATTVKGTKTQAINSLVLMGVFGLPALAMLIGVAVKRRALVGFTALLTGFALFTFGVFYAVIYFVLGGWLVYRAFKYNKQIAADKPTTRSAPPRKPRDRPVTSWLAPKVRRRDDEATDDDDDSGDHDEQPGTARRLSRREVAEARARATKATSKRYTPPRAGSAQRRGR